MTQDILQTIHNQMNTFSKGQKRIAAYLLESYDKAAFLTAGVLGKTVQVSESTVVRFASQLGYEGYPQMQKALQELVMTRLTAPQRMDAVRAILRRGGEPPLGKACVFARRSVVRTAGVLSVLLSARYA